MNSVYLHIADRLNRSDWLLSLLARFVFAATLLFYFWVSGVTKLGDGIFGLFRPSVGAYAQIFPKAMEAVGYDTSQLAFWHWAVVFAGTVAEFVLPLLIVIGLLTRLAALGMIGFVVVQSLTDIYGHGALEDPATMGAWFDRFPDSVIMDQRTFWVFVLLVLVLKGAGPLSADRALRRFAS
ncbi:DoxX family protein [Sulfitobacter sp. D35]|uniref:DoxX family protein n=1 Tax=Sulfitobacter sp. D35 TaxID=3083252 RepID=UPI00296E5A2D|nr:DoxX family protein [Sulfitobacter sp. D35]MDW4499651.1 DoxX family protein [Sulfitobacter sp. D35]